MPIHPIPFQAHHYPTPRPTRLTHTQPLFGSDSVRFGNNKNTETQEPEKAKPLRWYQKPGLKGLIGSIFLATGVGISLSIIGLPIGVPLVLFGSAMILWAMLQWGKNHQQDENPLLKAQVSALKKQEELMEANTATLTIGKRASQKLNTRYNQIKALMTDEQRKKIEEMLENINGGSTAQDPRLIERLKKILFELPWEAKPTKALTPQQARAELDKRVIGMDGVKDQLDRVILKLQTQEAEYKAGRIPKEEYRPTIICFDGPPGVGKTTLSKYIAHALGREFTFIPLGGQDSSRELRGWSGSYMDAKPGKLAQALIDTKTLNPIIALDEIDKMGQNHREANPWDILNNAFDPSQNQGFMDDYLQVPINLSQAVFITTANDLSKLPDYLRDRLQIIHVPGYLNDQKLEITQKSTLARMRKQVGLKEADFNPTKDQLEIVRRGWAPSGGMRDMERAIEALVTYVAGQKRDGKPTAMDYNNTRLLTQILGASHNYIEMVPSGERIGTANKMFYNSGGGRMGGVKPVKISLRIHEPNANYLPGLQLGRTGHETKMAGDTAVQAYDNAIAYIQGHAKQFGLSDLLKKHVIVDFLTDISPYDGPSAGTLVTTALISALTNKPIPADFAMTGTLNPTNGSVGAIGGLREKIQGAKEQGVKRIFYSAQNQSDFDLIEPELKQGITFTSVKTIDEVLTALFGEIPKYSAKTPQSLECAA